MAVIFFVQRDEMSVIVFELSTSVQSNSVDPFLIESAQQRILRAQIEFGECERCRLAAA